MNTVTAVVHPTDTLGSNQSFAQVEASLLIAGQLAKSFQKHGLSMPANVRFTVDAARKAARDFGLSYHMIYEIEAEGAVRS